MWPGRPPARASTSRTAASIRSHGPSSTAGSRLPCTPRSSPTAAQPASSGMRQSRPITSPPVAAMSASSVDVPVPKWIVGTPASRSAVEDPRRPRRDELGVVGRREVPDPRVEQLHEVGARARLRERVRRERVGELVEQRAPDLGLGVHQRLRHRELARRLALDEVARDGERPAEEADDRLLGRELAAHDADRLEDRRERLLRVGHAQLLDRGERAHRLGDRPGRRPRPARRRGPSRRPGS